MILNVQGSTFSSSSSNAKIRAVFSLSTPVHVGRCEEGRFNAQGPVLLGRGTQLEGQHRRTLVLVRQRDLHSQPRECLLREHGWSKRHDSLI